jgi:hypothetical protein
MIKQDVDQFFVWSDHEEALPVGFHARQSAFKTSTGIGYIQPSKELEELSGKKTVGDKNLLSTKNGELFAWPEPRAAEPKEREVSPKISQIKKEDLELPENPLKKRVFGKLMGQKRQSSLVFDLFTMAKHKKYAFFLTTASGEICSFVSKPEMIFDSLFFFE